ncbi:MAG: RiPP maturation radical SAM C-methyltransferase [Selenomonadaceae bacterium]|nr:RiPP maturation radical SAM C-methyltransferase [Selenomonadaceae bacterium]
MKKHVKIATAMGSANCMGSAGVRMLRAFPFVDYVFFGEADEIFAEVVKGALNDVDFPLPYGVLRQGDELPVDGPWPHRQTEDLDSLPLPDYDDFFASREFALPDILGDRGNYEFRMRKDGHLLLVMEGSRGCWWGERHPCKFCGLNGSARRYRCKSPERMAMEIRALREKYGDYTIFFSDSILSRAALKELPDIMGHFPVETRSIFTPRPIFSPKDCPSLFAETKSNLTEREVKSLAEIGFTMMQPGIEILSDHVLELMDKGNTAIRHLALLKYACRYRVYMTWNWLHAFPGETAKDYEEGIRLVPFITHLQPPVGFMSLVYHRNSVYTEHPEDYGLDLVPAQWYDFMSPDDDGYIADIAYVYKDRAHPYEAAPLLPLYRELDRLVSEWQVLADGEAFGDRLEMREGPESTEIIDFRKYRTATRHVLTGLAQRVYALCRAPVSLAKLAETLKAPEKEVMDVLADLEGRRLLIGIGGEYLALAVEVL